MQNASILLAQLNFVFFSPPYSEPQVRERRSLARLTERLREGVRTERRSLDQRGARSAAVWLMLLLLLHMFGSISPAAAATADQSCYSHVLQCGKSAGENERERKANYNLCDHFRQCVRSCASDYMFISFHYGTLNLDEGNSNRGEYKIA